MDTFGFMCLNSLGIVCWIVGAFFRPLSPLWVKVGVYPALLVLAIYFLILLARSEPSLWSNAQAGPGAVYIIALGVYSAIARRAPKRTNDGGARSA